MIEGETDIQLYPKEEEGKNIYIKNQKTNLKLKAIKEAEDNFKNDEEEQISEDESLGYKSNYKACKNNMRNQENIKEKITKRKSSTLSTTISHTDNFTETNSFLPPNNTKIQNNDKEANHCQPEYVFFGRERLNSTPITTYFEGLELYLRGLQPEKNEYQKTNNYVEKEIFFKEKNIPFKESKFKSFDMAEQKQFNSNKILKNIEENICKKTSDKIMSPPISVENNKSNAMQNNPNNFMPINTVNSKFNNCLYGKFDIPIYYFRYYNFDCKYKFYLIF
jgi:hypothetical protein